MKKLLGIIIWGVLVYLILNFLPTSYSSGTNFLASGSDTLLSSANGSKDANRVISVFGRDGKFLGGSVNSSGDITIYDIKNSSQTLDLLFAGTDKGLFASRNGGLDWHGFSDIENKIKGSTKIYQMVFSKDGRAYISTYEDGKGILYGSDDNFFSLDEIAGWDNEGVYSMSLADNDLYLGLSDGKLIDYSISDKKIQELNKFNSPIVKVEVFGGNIYLILKSGGFRISNDSGKSFREASYLNEFNGADNFKDFSVSPQNSGLIYAVTDYGFIRSVDNGNTWQVFKNLPVGKDNISAMAIDFSKNAIFLASGDKIYESNDNGKNWESFDLLANNRMVSIISLINDKIIAGIKSPESFLSWIF